LINAAWALLLSRYSGEADVVYGETLATRPTDLAGFDALVGPFINTLPVRVRIDPNTQLRAWLQQLQAQLAEIGQYAYSPLLHVHGWSDVPRGTPLFESILVFENYALDPALWEQQNDLAIRDVRCIARTSYPLCLMVVPGRRLSLILQYNAQHFDEVAVARMLGHYRTMLANMVAQPHQKLANLSCLTDAERQMLLFDWNATQSDFPADRCLHTLFEMQAERTPDAIALVCDFRDKQTSRQADKELTRDQGSGSREQDSRAPAPDSRPLIPDPWYLTYRELNRRANQLAHELRALGVGPEVLVGVYLKRSLELVIGLLGILKAGGAYLPLDTTYPAERLCFMLTDAQVQVLITQQSIYDLRLTIDDLGASDRPIVNRKSKIVNLDADWPQIARQPAVSPASAVQPDNAAYVIYTSGSTGRPKGTLIAHRGLVNYLSWCLQSYPVATGQGALLATSIAFDLSITALFAPLLVGRRVQLLSEDLGIAALQLDNQADFSLVKLTPAHLTVLSQQSAADQAAGWTRALIIGGEKLVPEQIAFWQTHAPNTMLINEYGPTETVVGCCAYRVPIRSSEHAAIPIGRPIANTRIYLLDRMCQPVPIGIVGELYIGSVGMARGYLNRPDLTAERFIPNPFAGDKETGRQGDRETRRVAEDIPQSAICNLQSAIGARLYRTGDLARYCPDGNIEFLGRVDQQVKLRGYRIELGEIEAVLCSHGAVAACVVMARVAASRDTRLVAYVVPTNDNRRGTIYRAPTIDGTSPSSFVQELHDHLRERLPDYMMPSAFVLLGALPLTAHGKIDRSALPAPAALEHVAQPTFVAPRTPVEESLAQIWTQLLGVASVGIHDNFFSMGGHSLLATQLISRIDKVFEVQLPIQAVFEALTVEALALIVVAHERRPGHTEKVARVLQRLKQLSQHMDESAQLEMERAQGYEQQRMVSRSRACA